jgi:alanyl-tRNA synthetase
VHYIEGERAPEKGSCVHGSIYPLRRRDHMQQHSAQHVLSAAFVSLFNMPTVSFHMGEEYCSIDLDASGLTQEQVIAAERLANQIALENRAVDVRFVTQEEARSLGLRKIPPVEKDELRLIDIRDFDLAACGGTHVSCTGQIGAILLRKTEKVRQGWRVEFVAGERAVATARRDYSTLAEAAGLFSSHIWDVPQQVRKSLDEVKSSRKGREQLLEEIAELSAKQLLAETSAENGRKRIVRIYGDRDVAFIKLLAQKLTRLDSAAVVLLGATSGQPSLVFAQSPGQPFDMGRLMKEAMEKLGGRGGGSKDLAQGGVPKADQFDEVVKELGAGLMA